MLLLVVAHQASAEAFGALSASLLVHGLLLGSVRALVGDMVIIRLGRPEADVEREVRVASFLVLVLSSAFGVLCLVAGALIGGDFGQLLMIVALAAPIVQLKDLLRSAAYGSRRIGDAIVLDGVWFGVQLVLTASLLLADDTSAAAFMLAWVAGAAASVVVGGVGRRLVPDHRGARRWIEEDGRRALGLCADFFVSTGVMIVSLLVIGAVVALEDFAGFGSRFWSSARWPPS